VILLELAVSVRLQLQPLLTEATSAAPGCQHLAKDTQCTISLILHELLYFSPERTNSPEALNEKIYLNLAR